MGNWIYLFSFPPVLLFIRLFLALVFLILFFGLSWNTARRLLNTNRLFLLLTATYVIFSWSLAMFFHLFIWFGLFKPLSVAIVFSITVALTLYSGGMKTTLYHFNLLQWFRNLPPLLMVVVFIPAALFMLLLVTRSLGLPLLGWDALTYHGLKAGLWVQQGRYFYDFNPPGGWEYYRTFFGGGELYRLGDVFNRHNSLQSQPVLNRSVTIGLFILF